MTPEEYPSYKRAMSLGGEVRRAYAHKEVGDWYVDPNVTKLKWMSGAIGAGIGGLGAENVVAGIESLVNADFTPIAEAGISLGFMGICATAAFLGVKELLKYSKR